MQKDVAEHVRKCEQYQKHAPPIHRSIGSLNPVSKMAFRTMEARHHRLVSLSNWKQKVCLDSY